MKNIEKLNLLLELNKKYKQVIKNGRQLFAKKDPGTRSPYGQLSLSFGKLLELSGSKINSNDKIMHININAKPIIYRNIFLTKLSFKIHVWQAIAKIGNLNQTNPWENEYSGFSLNMEEINANIQK